MAYILLANLKLIHIMLSKIQLVKAIDDINGKFEGLPRVMGNK